MSDIDDVFNNNKRDISRVITTKDKKVADYFLNECESFFKDRVEQNKADVKKWRQIAVGASVLSVLSVIALIVAMPLKTVETELVTIHDKTGKVDITRLSDANTITYGEALDKNALANFVISRNSYDWQTIQNSFNTVKIESTKNVFEQYEKYIQADNSPVNIFEDRYKVDITIDGEPVFLPASKGNDRLAQVQYTRKIRRANGDKEIGFPDTSFTATLTYNYKKSELSTQQRLVNPLGFQVSSYREDRRL